MGNADNLGGAPPPGPPPRPLGSGPPNWSPGGPLLGSGAPGEVPPSGSPNSGLLSGWRSAIGMFLLHGGTGNHYYYYYNAGAPAWNNNDQGDSDGLCEALSKPHTFASNQAQVAFTMSYLQSIALDYYTTILCFNPSHPLFTNWQAFVNEFFFKFRVFDTVAEAERKLASLRMSTDEHFTAFIVQFEKEAYKTGWNYNALRFQLSEALPKCIHDVL
ncbi:hypothetical protein C0995_015645 [Termitomyces sp. Mi166|nr:hypothetical protein C0995_015645 [Termitomyces sp. Mi166\